MVQNELRGMIAVNEALYLLNRLTERLGKYAVPTLLIQYRGQRHFSKFGKEHTPLRHFKREKIHLNIVLEPQYILDENNKKAPKENIRYAVQDCFFP